METSLCRYNNHNIHFLLSQPFSPAVTYSLRKLIQENIRKYDANGSCQIDTIPLAIERNPSPELKKLLHSHNKTIIDSLLRQRFSQDATEALEYMKAENDQIYKYDNTLAQLDRERYSGPENVWSYYDPVHVPNQRTVRSAIGSRKSVLGKKRRSRSRCRCNKL